MIKDIFGKETRGRKKRTVTTEMIEDLTKLSKDDYCEKHKVGEMFFLNLYYKNVGVKQEKEDESKQLDMFAGILCDTDILYEKGYAEWYKHIQDKQREIDWICSDIAHKIQIHSNVSQVEKIVLFDMFAEARKNREKYHTTMEFANTNRHKIIDFLGLQQLVKEKIDFIKNKRAYAVRVLKEEFGEVIK